KNLPTSFDYLVGAAEQRYWKGEAQHPSLKIDDQLDLHRLLNRQVGWLLAHENAAGVDADLTVRVRNAVSLANQAAGHGVLAKWIHRGDPAQAQYIWQSIADCDARGNAPVNVCPVHHSQACSLSNAAACADELMVALQLCPYVGSSAGTKPL